MKKIGILFICTGKYEIFWKDFYESAERFFLPDVEKEYFIFTDASSIFARDENPRIHLVHQENLGWPDNTLLRFHMFLTLREQLEKCDFLVFFNANARFLETISASEFLPENEENYIAVRHPGFYNLPRKKFPYENNPKSSAYIPEHDGKIYAQGALIGGRTMDFLDACATIAECVDTDKKNAYMAQWHDESHWNHFLVGRTDIKILSPSYAYPEDWALPFPEKIRMLDKSKFFSIGNVRKYSLVRKIKEHLYRFLKKHGLL